jgi:hypothetical protein
LRTGGFWTGHQRSVSGAMRLRFRAHIAVSASLTHNRIKLPDGEFAANPLALRLDYSFTPRMFVSAFIQYNGEVDAWLSNIRLNLIHHPLSDLCVVLNETRPTGEVRRALLVKYTHLIAS